MMHCSPSTKNVRHSEQAKRVEESTHRGAAKHYRSCVDPSTPLRYAQDDAPSGTWQADTNCPLSTVNCQLELCPVRRKKHVKKTKEHTFGLFVVRDDCDGERPERCRWQIQRGERVAVVGVQRRRSPPRRTPGTTTGVSPGPVRRTNAKKIAEYSIRLLYVLHDRDSVSPGGGAMGAPPVAE